jgi:hypothetical protein
MTDSLVTVSRGGLYVSRQLYETHFAGRCSVVLLRRDDDLLVLPVHDAAAGGYLLKLRNAAGDRVVHAADFFRAQDVDDGTELQLEASWNDAAAGLLVCSAFQTQGASA